MHADSPTPTLDVPGARLHYEVRGQGPLLALVGSPMDAASFAPLADLLAAEHTVLTTDPRGINRSPIADPDGESTPDLRADDLALLLAHLDQGPAAVFGSSGGAVTALALAQSHPERVHTVIAHEPPLDELLDNPAQRRAVTEAIIAAYQDQGRAAAWRLFLTDAGIELPDEVFDMMFAGEPEPQQGADERFFFTRELRHTTSWQPDIPALRATGTRILVGVGDASAGQICDHTSRALAAGLDTDITPFPGDHTGFVDDPASFATRLQNLLA